MPFLDPKDALAHLESYARGDGLSVRELMDSQKQGGLTYNVRPHSHYRARRETPSLTLPLVAQDFLVSVDSAPLA